MIRSLKPGPIAIGVAVDAVGSILFGLAYGIVTAMAQGADVATGPGEIPFTTADAIVNMVIGLSFTAIGGYVAGRLAGVRPIAHGTCVGLVNLVLSLVLEAAFPDASIPWWFTIVSVVGVLPAGSLGGLLAQPRGVG